MLIDKRRKMIIQLDNIDIAILQALMEDGRKSFRQISREICISTPTVKARFEQMVDRGLIKSISPVLDFRKVKDDKTRLELKAGSKKRTRGYRQINQTVNNNKTMR